MTGASRCSKRSSTITADNSAPIPSVLTSSCTITTRFVFSTDREDRAAVERHQRSQIDDLGFDAILRQAIGGLEGRRHHRAVGHERDVVALTADRRLADRDNLIPFGHRTLGAPVQVFVLEVDHRVVVADRRLQQAFRVVRRGWRDDLETGPVDEPRLRVLRVVQPAADVAAARRAHDDRHGRAPAVPVAKRRRLVDDLIETARDEVGELHLGNRPVAAQRGADADADDRRLGDRGVDDAHLAELVGQPLGDAECAAVGSDILAEHEHLRIAPHLFEEGLTNGFEVGQFFGHLWSFTTKDAKHGHERPGLRHTDRSPRRTGSGSGALAANSTASSIVALTRASMSAN